MTTVSQAYAVIRTRIEANKPASLRALYWQNEDGEPWPDITDDDEGDPALYTDFTVFPSSLVAFGGGRGANIYRHDARIEAYVFVPRGWGLQAATDIAEQVATLFRSYRDSDISCFDATVTPGGSGTDFKPPGLDSEVDNYYVALCQVSLYFDLLG